MADWFTWRENVEEIAARTGVRPDVVERALRAHCLYSAARLRDDSVHNEDADALVLRAEHPDLFTGRPDRAPLEETEFIRRVTGLELETVIAIVAALADIQATLGIRPPDYGNLFRKWIRARLAAMRGFH